MTERGTTGPARRAKMLAGAILAVLLVVTTASVVFHVRGASSPQPPTAFGPRGFAIFFTLTFGVVGTLLASRRPNLPFGWAFLTAGLLAAIQDLGDSYSHYMLNVRQVDAALAVLGVWIEYWIWAWLVGLMVLVLAFLFPSGTFLSRRWRNAFWVSIGLAFLSGIGLSLDPNALEEASRINPVRIPGDLKTATQIAQATPMMLVVALLLGVVALAVRFRRSAGDERRQLLWLLASISAVFICLLIYGVAEVLSVSGVASVSDTNPFFPFLEGLEVAMILSLGSIPVAAGAAILKYRLYSIEVVVNRAVVYGALAALITLIYGLAVVAPAVLIFGFRGGQVLLPIVATAIIALVVQPLRRGLQRFANRVVYGKRATPYEAMSDFSHRIAGAFSVEETLPQIAQATAEGVAAKRAQVTLYLPDGDARSASWPPSPNGDGFDRSLPIRHRGELVGELAVAKDSRDPITEAEERLLNDLASQAGLALHNVRLAEDLRASRRRIVGAQDEERRRLERNLHDGAQQSLVALKLKIGIAGKLTQSDPEKAREILAQLEREADETLQNVRDLARGIFPPLLADQGLTAALKSQASKSSSSVEVIEDGVGRYPPELEAAVYFCCLEAMQNAAKYGRGAPVEVRLSRDDGALVFEVRDEGPGFDSATVTRGSGLQNMSDRVEALGGWLEIDSEPGRGTSVRGSVPVPQDERAEATFQAAASRSGLNSDLDM